LDAEGLKLKIDSKGAQQDLAALSKVLDKTAGSADKLDKAFARAAVSTDQNLTRAAKSMEKYAQVAALLSKIKIAGSPVGQIQELGKALDQIGRAKQINLAQVNAVKELGAALGTLRVSERVMGVATFLNSLGRVRVPSQAQVRNVREFFSALSTFKGTTGSEQLSRLLNTLSTARAPSQGTITRLQQMFTVLAEAREMPGAGRIANQLDTIALAANRASRALGAMPNGGRSLFSAGGATPRTPVVGAGAGAAGVRANAGALTKTLGEGEEAARKAAGSFAIVGRGLDDLSGRFRLSYQAGTLLTTMFASFTAGQFIRSLYDANTQLLKLQKAVLFATGTFDGANEATDKFVSMSQELGLSIKDNIDTYGRFVIASKASNVSLDETNKIYHAVGQAMTVVGSSAQQQQLAFYGLTEMLQKGVVYSKEFNRQIGAQLPGNAILGARALSKLEGHVVSVSEFFQRMHTGTLLSPQFVPAWADEVEKMYHPLLALAQARPDVALSRLNNAFFVFAKQVGQGSFMTAIGHGLTDLLNKIVQTKDGVTTLTAPAQHLADTLGHGLASTIHGLTQGVGFLVDHFDLLFTSLKGFLAFKVAGEFGAIANSAMKATEKMFGFSSAARAAAASEAAIGQEARITATQTAVAAIAAPGANEAAAISNIASGASFGRRRPPTAFQRASGTVPKATFGQRLNLPLFNWADQNDAAVARIRPTATGATSVTGAQMRAALAARPSTGFFGSAVTGALSGGGAGIRSGIGSVIEKAASGLALLGPAAVAAAVGLAMFSDKASGITSAKGNSVTYGDVADGIFSNIGDSVTGFVKTVGEAFGMFGDNALSLGKVVLSVGAIIKATFSLMFDLAHALGTIIGGAIAGVIAQIITWGKVIGDVVTGHFGDAAKDYKAGQKQQYDIASSTFGQAGSDIGKIFTTDRADNIYKQMSAAADRSADSRTAGAHADEATKKQLEAALRQQNAAAIIEAAAQKFEDSTIGMNQIGKMLDPDKVLTDLKTFAAGNLTSGATPELKSIVGNAGNNDLRGILANAGATAGVDPNRLYALGMAESGFDPNKYNWSPGHHAQGAFQLMPGTISDLKKQYGDFDPMKVSEAAPMAARYLAQADSAAEGSIGRKLSSQESYIPYVMGPTGGANFLKAYGNTPDATAANLFPSAAKNNESLFYTGKGKDRVALTMEQSYAQMVNRIARVGVSLAPGEDNGPLDNGQGGATSAAQGQGLNKVALNAYKQVMAIIGKGSPQAAAMSGLQTELENLTTVRENLAKALSKESPFAKTFLSDNAIMDGITHAIDELKKKVAEANDPIANMIRLNKQSNDVTELRVKGLNAEADVQSEVNKLVESGYTPEDAKKMADANMAAWKAEQNRTDVLSSQLELQKQLNEIETRRMDRLSNSGLDNLVNASINAAAKPGENLQQARARLTSSGQMGVIQQNATAQFAENRSSSIQGMGEDIDTLRQHAGPQPRPARLPAGLHQGVAGHDRPVHVVAGRVCPPPRRTPTRRSPPAMLRSSRNWKTRRASSAGSMALSRWRSASKTSRCSSPMACPTT
jgi:tape measure domain-containing protein